MLQSAATAMDLNEVPTSSFARHPWEVARARFFCRTLRESEVLTRRLSVLDVGAGDGYFARLLAEALPAGSDVTCQDTQYTDADLRRFSRPPTPRLTFVRERPAARFDLVLLLDVLEHVDDDVTFLRDVVGGSLAPGGYVLISVPAWPALSSRHDVALEHHRRYSPEALGRVVAAAGLATRAEGDLFHAPVLMRLLTVARERVVRQLGREPAPPPNLGEWRRGAAVSKVVGLALALDNAVSRASSRRRWRLPGLSAWKLCLASSAEEAVA